MTPLQRATRVGLALCAILSLSACQHTGSGTSSVTCEAIRFVYLSRKDTKDTIKQVVANNGAWVAICGDPKKR